MKQLIKIKKLMCLCTFKCLTLIFILTACGDLNDIHQKYLDEKPVAYIGIADKLTAYGGKDRVKLVWVQDADPRIVKTIIYWNDGESSVSKDFVRTTAGAQKDSIIIPLSEGTYTFKVVNEDEEGARSIVKEVQGRSYGETYEGSLRTRPFSEVKYINDIPRITWDVWNEASCTGTELTYKSTASGMDTTVFIKNEDGTTDLLSINEGDQIHISSLYYFNNVIDTLRSRAETLTLPVRATPRIPVGIWTVAIGDGKRLEYKADGTFDKENAYSATIIEKTISIVDEYDGSSFFVNRLGSFGVFATPATQYMKLTVDENNIISISGEVPGSYTIHASDKSGKTSYYDPDTKTIYLYSMRTVNSNKTQTVFEEKIVFKGSE